MGPDSESATAARIRADFARFHARLAVVAECDRRGPDRRDDTLGDEPVPAGCNSACRRTCYQTGRGVTLADCLDCTSGER